MGNSNTSKPGELAKNRRYSRSSAFTHGMDNIRDKQALKITMKQTSDMQGNFSLSYLDESIDDFMTIRSNFTFSGRYQHVSIDDEKDLFGVGFPPSFRPDFLEEKQLPQLQQPNLNPTASPKLIQQNRSDSLMVGSSFSTRTVDSDAKRSSSPAIKHASVTATRFFTEKLVCKLTEGNSTQYWTVSPSTQPDCLETTPQDIINKVSWLWSGVDGAKVTHTAPPGSLDFLGLENIEQAGPTIDLRIRIPQLAAGNNPPILRLNELSGWKLGKKSLS